MCILGKKRKGKKKKDKKKKEKKNKGKKNKGKKNKGKKNKGVDYGGPFGGGGLTTQNGAKSRPKPPRVIHNFVRNVLNTKLHDVFNPSKAKARV